MCDLADGRCDRVDIAQYSALNLVSVDELLDQYLGIPAECLCQTGNQGVEVVRASNADRRAGRAGLDEHRVGILELFSRCACDCLCVLLVIGTQRDVVIGLTHAGGIDDDLGQALIHRVCRSGNARADKRNARKGQQTLHGSVLTAHAVQHWEANVNADGLTGLGQDDAVSLAVGRQHGAAQARLLLPFPTLDLLRVGVFIQKPSSISRDADGHQIIFCSIGVCQNRGRRNTGNAMLVRQSAE